MERTEESDGAGLVLWMSAVRILVIAVVAFGVLALVVAFTYRGEAAALSVDSGDVAVHLDPAPLGDFSGGYVASQEGVEMISLEFEVKSLHAWEHDRNAPCRMKGWKQPTLNEYLRLGIIEPVWKCE